MANTSFKNALISVSDKSGLVDFLKPLVQKGLRILSTGGTAQHLRDHGFKVIDVSEQTGFPEVMDGRVKTLHPKIHMALLARDGNPQDAALLLKEGLEPIDLLVVNLYPFEQQLGRGLSDKEQTEFIDIGGPSLLRGAAKNHQSVTVVCDPADYHETLQRGPGDLAWRRHLAAKVFAHTASYDAMIARHLGVPLNNGDFALGGKMVQSLRYGENPAQSAVWLQRRGAFSGLHQAQILQGKELSYNNLLDLDAAVLQVKDFSGPAAVAVKHNNPCGVAVHHSPNAALTLALTADPVSVFGGIVATNFELTADMIEQVNSIFLECLIVPSLTTDAADLLKSKKNLRVLTWPALSYSQKMPCDETRVRSVLGGYLMQTADAPTDWQKDWKVIGEKITDAIRVDLELAWKVVARLKSNAIAIAGRGQTLGLGMGQVNRVDAVDQAIQRWQHFHKGIHNAVLASDAFFPFADSIEKIAASGIRYVIQPGGSVRDPEVMAAAEKHGITLVLTGRRHFAH